MKLRRAVTRETGLHVFDGGKHRAVMVTIEPITGTLSFRLKGRRTSYPLPASYLFWHALKKWSALEKANKAKERKKRRKAKK